MTSKKLSRFMIAALAVGSSTSALAQKSPPMWDGKESVVAYAKRAKLKPTETIDLGGGVKMELVLVPAATFVMGSPDSEAKTDEHKGKEPQHKVTLTKPFYMTKYEVTQPQYEKIVGANPSRNKGDQFPVVDVSWEDAMAFAKKAGEVMKRDVRIPTDAQWEHAARAGTQTAVYTGDDDAAKDKAGWCGANSGGKVHPVGEKVPNAFGLYDMIGNVREWTKDINGPLDGKDATDPEGPASGDMRTSRDGAFTGRNTVCRAAIRNVEPATKRSSIIGVRLIVMP